MRLPLAILTLVSTTFALFAGCGGGGGGIDCTAICNKASECSSSTDMAKCTSDCDAANQLVDPSYGSALEACASLACDKQGECAQDALKSCANDTAPYIDAYCAKLVSCSSQITMEACKAELEKPDVADALAALKCINDDTLSKLTSCVDQAACLTIAVDTQKCVDEIIADISGSASSSTP